MPIDLDSPIDPNDPAWKCVLASLQGNILKSHGRDHTALLVMSFTRGKFLRSRLQKFAAARVTSAEEQQRQVERFRVAEMEGRVASEVFANIFVSVWGYRSMEFTESLLRWGFPHPQNDDVHVNWFLEGMEHQGGMLCDPPRPFWEAEYATGQIDAILLLACDDLRALDAAVNEALDEMAEFARVIQIERGKILRRDGYPIEHFGFADGISQPQFFKGDPDVQKPSAVLVRDILAGDPAAHGSYVVYRKLEQNVRAFRAAEAKLADALGLQDRERAGAMIVGRFRDGTPLERSGTPGNVGDNLFKYDENDGSRCPFHAHIRKVNQRDGSKARIARRGVPYGPYNPIDASLEYPEHGSGLLFLSFQRLLQIQFGGVMTEWVNLVHFPVRETGKDPLIGQGFSLMPQRWPLIWNQPSTQTELCGASPRFVTLKGGEFLFAPSLTWFDSL